MILKKSPERENLASAKRQARLQKKKLKAEQRKRAKVLRAQKKTLEKSSARSEKQIKKKRAPQKASDCLGFLAMYENGICEIEPGLYSMTLKFSDVNYQIARREEQANIFTRYCELLNYCDPDMHLQINLVTQHMDRERFEQDMFFQMRQNDIDEYRQEMNKIIADKAMQGQNGLVREKFVTITVKADTYDSAAQQLARRSADLKGSFKGLHSDASTLSGKQRLALLNAILRPDTSFDFEYDWLLAENKLTTKDFISPSSFDWRPEHDDSRATYNDRYAFGKKIGKTVFLRDIAPEMTDDLLSRLSELPFDLAIALHIDAVEQHDAVEMVKTKLAFMRQEEADGMQRAVKQKLPAAMGIRYELSENIKNAEDLLDELVNRNQKLFKVALMIHTYGNTNEELDNRIKQIMSAVQKKTCKVDTLPFEQREALNSILPLGKKCIGIERTLTTANTAIFIPFTTQELFEPGGFYMGLNARSKSLLMFQRKNLASPAGYVLGQPGSGKSMDVKLEIAQVMMGTDDDVIIIDPEGEYTPEVQAMGGQVVEISASSSEHINPMDITEDYADSDSPLVLKSQFLQMFCELIIGGGGISAAERTYIDRAARMTYAKFFNSPQKMNMPSLKDFYDNLVKQGPGAEDIATALSIYVDGSMDIFAHQTNVDIHNRLVCYNTVKLGKPMQTLGMMVVLDQIWNRITLNRVTGRRTWVYTDEFQLLLRDKESMNYYFEISGRARKWGAILTSITQHVESILMDEDARRMLSDCQYIKLLNQAPLDAQQLGKLLKISPEELDYITNVDAGNGLLIAGRSVVPFSNEFPENTKLYKLMDTNPNSTKSLPRI
ncbi:MAG: conjugal transfer protein [Subdoligranulum variabile]|nr:MAG: conjugal transfer protein [Subdoligranulum variabile]